MTQPEDHQPTEPTTPESATPGLGAQSEPSTDAIAPYATDPYAADPYAASSYPAAPYPAEPPVDNPYPAGPYGTDPYNAQAQNPYPQEAYGQPGYPSYPQPAAPYGQPYQAFPGQPMPGYPMGFAPGIAPAPIKLTGGRLGLAAGQIALSLLIIAVGFLPWFTSGSESVSGYAITDQGDSSDMGGAGVSAFFAIVALIMSIISVCLRRRGMTVGQAVVCLVMGLFVLALAGSDAAEGDLPGIDPGAGLLLTALLGLAMTVLSIVQLALLPRRIPTW